MLKEIVTFPETEADKPLFGDKKIIIIIYMYYKESWFIPFIRGAMICGLILVCNYKDN